MVEEQATVVDSEGDYVWVETQRQTSCGSCSVKNGCGTQVLSRVLGNKRAYVRCLNSCQAKIGDQVVIGINESALLSGSFLLYMLPLLSMIVASGAGVAMARLWWPAYVDLVSIVAAFIGLLSGLKYANSHSKGQNKRVGTDNSSSCSSGYEPVILRKVTPQVSSQAVVWNK